MIPLRLELLHDVEKLVIYPRVIRKTNFDLVQIWQGIFNLNMEKRKKKSVQNKAQAVSAGCMEQHFPQNPATVLTVDDFTATKLVYRFQMLRFALLINAFISDLYYKITGSPIVQICFSAAYVKLRECWLICSLSAKVQHQQILWLAVQAVQLTLK